MKKEYTAPPAAEILRFDGAILCADESSLEPERPWGDKDYVFPMIPL